MSVVKTGVAAAALDMNEKNNNDYDAAKFMGLARMRGVDSKVRMDAVVCLYLQPAPFTVLFMFVR